jgi:lysophospholipase L1-like esterase
MRWLRNVLLAAAGMVAGLALLEIGLQIVGISYANFYHADYYRGWSLRPGAEEWWRQEGNAYVRINSDGLRDVEHSKAKPLDTYRIAVLGDSFAEAMEVSLDEDFSSVMERKLAHCEALGGKRIEVINFGVSGYGTAQELITLRRKVWQYSPDAVILAITTSNDIRNNSRALEPEKRRPFFRLVDGHLVEDDSFRSDLHFKLAESWLGTTEHWLMNRSRVLQVVLSAISVIEAHHEVEKWRALDPKLGRIDELFEEMVYQSPNDPEWQKAWSVTDALLVEMNKEVSAKGALFLAVTLSNSAQVDPDPRRAVTLARTLGVNDLFFPEERIRALGEKEGFAVLNLAEPMAAYAIEHHVYLHGFSNTVMGRGHWNAAGHQLAGELISDRFCQIISSGLRQAAH